MKIFLKLESDDYEKIIGDVGALVWLGKGVKKSPILYKGPHTIDGFNHFIKYRRRTVSCDLWPWLYTEKVLIFTTNKYASKTVHLSNKI